MATEALDRSSHLQRGIHLEYVTIGWNLIEGFVAIAGGSVAGSIALVGFGLDSLIETSSGSILLWRLRAERSPADVERLERKALRLVGISFIALAFYVAFDSIKTLVQRERPESSPIGIGLAVLSLVVMPWLAHQKRKTASDLNSAAMKADSRQTSLCAYLSVILIGGLLLNALLGWWWADPVAGLVMLPIIVKEGVEALRGETCADCS